jgi:hypothetical protein
MSKLHDAKFVQVIAPAAIVDNASWTTNEIDTLGYNYATVIFNLGATDIAMAALKLQESDTTGSGFADITGADIDAGATDIDGTATALPSATDDNNLVVIQVDLRGRKRFLDLVATAGDGAAGSFASAVCVLSQADVAPESVAGAGCETLVRI